LSATVTKLAINQIWSKVSSFKMRTTATLTHAAETTLSLITAAAQRCSRSH